MSDGPIVYGLLAYKNSLLFTKLPFSLFSKPASATASVVSPNKPKPSKLHPSSLCDVCYSEDQVAVLDLIQYYHVVNMCTNARVCASSTAVLSTNISYCDAAAVHDQRVPPRPIPVPRPATRGSTAYKTQSRQEHPSQTAHISARRIRKFIMRKDISLVSFDRDFLHALMLEKFESPFSDDCTAGAGAGAGADPAPLARSTSPVDDDSFDTTAMVIEMVHPNRFRSTKTKLSELLHSSEAMLLARDHPRETRRESFWKIF